MFPKVVVVAAEAAFDTTEKLWNAEEISIRVISRTNAAILFCFKNICPPLRDLGSSATFSSCYYSFFLLSLPIGLRCREC